MTNNQIVRSDPMFFVADNRIMPEKAAFQDKDNPNIWMHSRDFAPDRKSFLRAKLISACSLEYPPYTEDKTRNSFIEAIRAEVPCDPKLSSIIPESAKQQPLPSSPYERPIEHLVNGEPFAPLISEADLKQYRDSIAVYTMLEIVLDNNGYPNSLKDAVIALENRDNTKPSVEQLFNELKDALSNDSIKISTAEMLRALRRGGMEGVAEILHVSPDISNEINGLMDHIMPRGFPLNDVLNWQFGRREPHMEGASVEEKLAVGLEARVNYIENKYSTKLKDFTAVPNEIENERLIASSFNYMPPVLSELFFEEGGVVIATRAPDLGDLLKMPATGFHITYESPANPENAMHQVFISQELGLPKNTRTLVHEINHMFYPEMIGMSWASHADDLLMHDETRIKYLKGLVDQYATGDDEMRHKVMQGLNLPEFSVGGRPFSDMMDNTSMQTFIGAVNEAYHYLQMESPTYNRIGTYSEPLDRFREVIPRYAEMRYVEHVDHQDMMSFIVPGITEIYQDMYIPHLEERLNHIRQTRPSKIDALVPNLSYNDLYSHDFVDPRFMQPWEERIGSGVGEILVRHPAGDNRPVINDFVDTVSTPTVDQISDMSALDTRPPALKDSGIYDAPMSDVGRGDVGGADAGNVPVTNVATSNVAVPFQRKSNVPDIVPVNNISSFTIRADGQVVTQRPELAASPR